MGILQGTWISSTFINKHAVIFGPTTILQRTYYIMFTAVVYTGLYIIYIVVMSSGRRTAAVCVLYPMRGIVHRRVYIWGKGWWWFIARTRISTSIGIYLYSRLWLDSYICIGITLTRIMASKLKPSVRSYVKDARGRQTNKFEWKHYTPAATKTEELLELYQKLPRKRGVISVELQRRGIDLPVLA